MGDPDVWPVLLDMNRDECKRILRRLELEAYSNLVSVLRAQGSLTAHKRRLLKSVAQTLSISEERHKAECRRAVNSEKLATIAWHMGGVNTGTEWAIEGRRLVPLLPRLVPQTAFTAIADRVAHMAVTEGARLPLPVQQAKKRLQSPPIDESLLEPSIPEASKTLLVSSASPSPVESCSSPQPLHAKPAFVLTQPAQPVTLAPPAVIAAPAQHLPPTTTLPPTHSQVQPTHQSKLSVQGITLSAQHPASISPVQVTMSAHTQSHPQLQPMQTAAKVVKNEDVTDDRMSRKRPRSASLDAPQGQTSVMPPPVKKEALSPPSPHLTQISPTMSPQSHSQLVQQQTLQAAAAAAAAEVITTLPVSTTSQLCPPVALSNQAHATSQPHPSAPAASQTAVPRTVTIPTQGTVKLCLGSTTATSSGTGISPGTHKVIIVSSTAPSILQRSLSVPVVKTFTTSAPSQPSSSTPVQSQQPASCGGSNVRPEIHATAFTTSASGSSSSPISSVNVSSSNASKISNKLISQTAPKARPRANSIVIPVTPNPTNVLSGVSATSMQLKTALQASKMKTSDSTGLKILPLSNVPSNAKILPKPPGPGPIYVVSSTSVATQNVSVVTRTVPSGARVMTFTSSSLPRVAVSTSQAGTILSMSPKPVQTLQLAAGNAATPCGAASGKPNVIVVQKGSAAFSRGAPLSHAGKDVVAKVLLGGKGLTSLSHVQGSALAQASTSQSQAQPAAHVQIVQSQSHSLQPSQTSLPSQTLQSSVSSQATTQSSRMVTIQKLPSTLVQGSGGSNNVIVFDLSQEQFNNSAVLNEIFGGSLLGSNNAHGLSHESAQNSRSLSAVSGVHTSTESSANSTGMLLEGGGSLLVQGLDSSLIDDGAEHPGFAGSSTVVDYVERAPENAGDCAVLMAEDSFIDGAAVGNENAPPIRPSNTCSDIFSTALSNANLNLNDFLEDSSLDGDPSAPGEGTSLGLTAAEHNSISCHTNPSGWVSGDNSQNSHENLDSNQV